MSKLQEDLKKHRSARDNFLIFIYIKKFFNLNKNVKGRGLEIKGVKHLPYLSCTNCTST